MAGFNTTKQLADSELKGATKYSTWRKTPSQITTNAVWFDLSMSAGNPVPQYYASSPLVSIAFKQSVDGGIPHGGNVSPKTKHLRKTTIISTVATALPMPMILCDYLMFYPFIDEGSTDEQFLTNSIVLPRYSDGAGVQIMAVSVASRTGGQSFFVNYTNQDGVAGRITPVVIQNTATANGHIVTSQSANALQAGPFLPLQGTDTGVRSIESVTMLGTDVGLFTLVLIKPLATSQILEITAPVEIDHFIQQAIIPQIQDDAYLNWLCLPQASLSGTALHGDIEVVWN